MIEDLAVMVMWGIGCALLGTVCAFALFKWAPNWSLTTRVFVAIAASTFPIFGVAGFALVGSGGLPMSLLSMSADEFLVPFAIQIVLIIAFAGPATWLVSRGSKTDHPADIFE